MVVDESFVVSEKVCGEHGVFDVDVEVVVLVQMFWKEFGWFYDGDNGSVGVEIEREPRCGLAVECESCLCNGMKEWERLVNDDRVWHGCRCVGYRSRSVGVSSRNVGHSSSLITIRWNGNRIGGFGRSTCAQNAAASIGEWL